ncbi:MAG TPA: DHA2 family efflux MFS transporter permease subunit [Cellulomonas sp.]
MPLPDDAATSPATARRNSLVIGLLLVSTFVVFLNETIMGVALPHLMADLDISAVAAQWLTTAFLLTMAVVIPVTGLLLQRFPTRTLFVAAMSLFSLGTLVAALAPGFDVLLAARVIQASGTAIMMPLLMTTVMELVPERQRGRTMGNIAIVISVAPAIGPTISGLILSALPWRFMFVLVLPLALAALGLGIAKVENVTQPRPTPIDAPSVVLSALGFGGLVLGLSQSGGSGAGSDRTAAITVGVGVVALGAFVWRQLRLQDRNRALLDLRTFRFRTFSVSVVVLGIAMVALFGTIILLPMYMQDVLGMNVLRSGLLLLPGGLVMGLLGPVVGRLYDRVGPRPLLVPGVALVAVVLWALTTVRVGTPWGFLLAAHVALSVGLAFTFTPLFSSALGALPERLYSHGSATVGTIQQVAGAAGTALFIAVMSGVAASQGAAGADQVHALAAGIRTAFLCGAVISLFGVVAALFVGRTPAHGAPAAAAH